MKSDMYVQTKEAIISRKSPVVTVDRAILAGEDTHIDYAFRQSEKFERCLCAIGE